MIEFDARGFLGESCQLQSPLPIAPFGIVVFTDTHLQSLNPSEKNVLDVLMHTDNLRILVASSHESQPGEPVCVH